MWGRACVCVCVCLCVCACACHSVCLVVGCAWAQRGAPRRQRVCRLGRPEGARRGTALFDDLPLTGLVEAKVRGMGWAWVCVVGGG